MPLYEVLSRSSAPATTPDDTDSDSSEPTSRSLAKWLANANLPLIIRLPRGLAILFGIAGLAMVLLAYWVGANRQAPGPAHHASLSWQITPITALSQPPKRLKNRSYLALTTFPRNPNDHVEHLNEAIRCALFLGSVGVVTTVDPTNNGDLQLVSLHPFERLEGDAYHAHMRELHQWGRVWKEQHQGSTDFAPRPVQYTGP